MRTWLEPNAGRGSNQAARHDENKELSRFLRPLVHPVIQVYTRIPLLFSDLFIKNFNNIIVKQNFIYTFAPISLTDISIFYNFQNLS